MLHEPGAGVLVRLNATEMESKSSEPRTCNKCFGAGNRVDDVVALGRENSVHYVVGEAAYVTQVELAGAPTSTRNQFVEIDFAWNWDFCFGSHIFNSRVSEGLRQREWELVLGNHFDDAVGGAAQSKGIF